MLATKDFVMINFPKTGSTFARNALMRVYEPTRLQRLLGRIGVKKPTIVEYLMKQDFFTEVHARSNPVVEQHGAVSQIPLEHIGKPILSVVRNPLDRLISIFEFRNWVERPFPDQQTLEGWFPHFPELSFDEFLEMSHRAVAYAQPEGMRTQVGMMTTQFIRFYAHDPLKTMLALRDDTDLVKDYDQHFPKVHFLHTESLSKELHQYLFQLGIPEDRISFILDMKKLNTTKRSLPVYMTPGHVARIQQSERLLFQLFPEYSVE